MNDRWASSFLKVFSLFSAAKPLRILCPNSYHSLTEPKKRLEEELLPTKPLEKHEEDTDRAIRMIEEFMKYSSESSDMKERVLRQDVAIRIIEDCLRTTNFKDNLYVHLMKQTMKKLNRTSKLRLWELWLVLSAFAPPSRDYISRLSEFIHSVMRDESEDEVVHGLVERVWNTFKRSTKAGQRKAALRSADIEALWENKKLVTRVSFLDGNSATLDYEVMTTVQEAVELLAENIEPKNFNSFTIYKLYTPRQDEDSHEAVQEQHVLLDENRYIADILAEAKAEGIDVTLLFKKKMFREQDEHITEPAFVNLSYAQAQHDFLQGNYPVVKDDASQMCALQIFAAQGPGLDERSDVFLRELDKNLTKQVRMTRPGEEWRRDVYRRYVALSKLTQEHAKLQFLRILRSLPYGNSVFFSVKRTEDPTGLLPSKLILGINKRGVHFFRPVPKEYLRSAELRDIMQFGSSSQVIFFKMRVAGVLHIFQFETPVAEDICMALQTHIDDIMMKRYDKTNNRAGHKNVAGLPQTKCIHEGDRLLKQMQEKLDNATARIQHLRQQEKDGSQKLQQMREKLETILCDLKAYESERMNVDTEIVAALRVIDETNQQLRSV